MRKTPSATVPKARCTSGKAFTISSVIRSSGSPDSFLGPRVPQAAQRKLEQRQSVRQPGGLAGELVDQGRRDEAQAHLVGRFLDRALDVAETDGRQVALVILTDKPHVQRL